MKLIGDGISYSNKRGNNKNVLFKELFSGGVKCQKKKSRKDAVFDEMQNLIFKHKSKIRGANTGNGRDDKDQ